MSEIEDTVSLLERMADWRHLDGCEPYVLALIADWRKRGEALEAAEKKLADIRSRAAYLPINMFTV